MIDDDLNRLLQDIDDESDYKSAGVESIRAGRRAAKSGDSIAKEVREEVVPEKAFVEKTISIEIDKDTLLFKSGILNVLQEHQNIANDFVKLTSDVALSEEVYDVLKKYKYTFSKYTENIINIFEKYSAILSVDSLNRSAKKDFSILFEGFEEDNKINFLILKEIFIRLKEFNSLVKKEWDDLYNSISVINLASESKSLYLELNNNTQSGLDLCRKTERFLHGIGEILEIPEDDFDVLEKDLFNKIVYNEALSYKYDDIFNRPEDKDELKASIEPAITEIDEGDETEPEPQLKDEIPDACNDIKEKSVDAEIIEEREDYGDLQKDSSTSAVKFTIKGTRSWNSQEPYIIRVNNEKLEMDYQHLSSSFFFLDAPQEGSSLEGKIRIAMVKFLRDTTKSIVESYKEFIVSLLDSHVEETGRFFGFEGSMLKLFIYHLGPFSIYRILINGFQSQKIGECYRCLEGRRVSQFIPYEFIKEAVLGWFEKNINVYDLQFDGVQEFNEIRKTVSKKYYSEVDRITNVIDEVIKKSNLETKKDINKFELFKSKWNRWFGIANIVIYKRFIVRTIF